jgi:phage gp29-like protein
MNVNTHINSNRLRRALRWRFNPIRNLTVDTLAAQLDAFDAGFLREAAETWEIIERRDDILRSVIPKRKKALSRHGWVVLPARELQAHEEAESKRHIAALEYFYRNLECSNAVDANERGGFSLLARQMMDAVGKRYAVHEIIWRPKADGTLTASLRFVPLSFFENTTGQLRFLENESAMEGTPLKDGEWMITVGDGLMVASSIAWMFKNLSMNDWSLYSEHNGSPGLRATTSAVRDSDEWKAVESAVADLYNGMPVVTNTGDDIKVVDFAVGGNIPFPGLIERMDRVMAAMWRGADLSTISRDRGYGASLQEKESCILEEDDGQMISETLNRQIDRWVIKYLFGADVEPLARVKVLVSGRECTADDARVDEFLLKHGAPLSVASVMERYGRALPRPGEPLLNAPEAENASGGVMSHMENSRGAGTESAADKKNVRLSNAADSGFNLLQKEWVQLSPYGDFPHSQGLQRVSFEAAKIMERNFATIGAKASRLFAGAPMFVGHPDVPQFAQQFPDRKAYGWIMALEARPDGLYGRMKWSAAGLELLQNGHYKFLSPYWEARQIGEEEGRAVFEPVALISAGLTNEPNLPVQPLANVRMSPLKLASMEVVIEEALANGRLTPDRIVSMQHELAEAWDVGVAKLRTAPIVMHTRAYTEKLGARKNESMRFSNRRMRVHELVQKRMREGMSYDQAWNAVKEEHPGLFV